MTGVKVFIINLHATSGTGSVSVANSDRTANLMALAQGYYAYDEVVAPDANSEERVWKLNVPNSVSRASMRILVTAHFSAEMSVTLSPPDSTAVWTEADSNTGGRSGHTVIDVPYQKRTVMVVFQPWATLVDRQLAVASVDGQVVGGHRSRDGVSGWYIIEVPDDGTGSGVLVARGILRQQRQIKSALVNVYGSTGEDSPVEKLETPHDVTADSNPGASRHPRHD